jgi:preprotein translocase subunit YajC
VFARQAIARVLPTEDADDAEEAPLSEEEATLTDEDLERLRSSDDEGKKDDKKDK